MNATGHKIYYCIVQHKVAHDGNSPTIREIAAACDIASTSHVYYWLARLAGAGWIVVRDGRRRAIEVVGGRWIPPSVEPS